MTEIGEIKIAEEIGKVGYWAKAKFIWSACIDCGKEKWTLLMRGKPKYLLCQRCTQKRGWVNGKYALRDTSGEKNPNWRGGRFKDKSGYIMIKLSSKDFFFTMTNANRYVFEHRLAVAKALGRCLQPWEIVHHKEGYT